MSQLLEAPVASFFDRRQGEPLSAQPQRERRQFADARAGLSVDAQELAHAIDQYKLTHRRRFISYEEMLDVILSLGYHR